MSFTPPLWSLTQTQVLDSPMLTSMQGHVIRPKEDPNNALYVWRGDVDRAITLKLPVSEEVIASRQRNAHPITSPKILQNVKGRPFTWSFTALNDFEGCPKRYSHRRFYCDVTEEETEALRWGNRVHTAAEKVLKGQEHSDPEAFVPVAPYVNAFLTAQGEKHAEFEICLTENMEPVSWFDKKAWYRGKLDVLIIHDGTAKIFDYKTGKLKDDPDQLEIFAASLAVVRPELHTFVPKFIWLKDKQITGCPDISKAQTQAIWEKLLGRVERMRKAWAAENFPARASGLCKWCPAFGICQYRKG